MKARIRIAAAVLTMALLVVACSKNSSTNTPTATGAKPPLVIGISLSASGDFSDPAAAAQKGYQLWADSVNAKGGILGRQVQLKIVDDASSPDQVKTNYETLITKDKVDLVLGPFSTLLSIPAAQTAQRYGYAFTNEPRWGAQKGLDLVNELGLKGLLPDLPNVQGVPNVAFSGLGLTTITQQAYRNPGFYNRAHFLQDHYSWFRGKHSIKAGAQITRYDANDVSQSLNLYGNMTFGNRYTGFPYADFLLGIPTTARRAGPALDSPFSRMAYDFFATDEYKITPKLTLSLGLRYELHPFWSSGNDLASVFDIKTGAIVVPDGSVSKVSALFPSSYVKVIGASQAGYSGSNLLSTDKNNVAPRVSLAWRPLGAGCRPVTSSGSGRASWRSSGVRSS